MRNNRAEVRESPTPGGAVGGGVAPIAPVPVPFGGASARMHEVEMTAVVGTSAWIEQKLELGLSGPRLAALGITLSVAFFSFTLDRAAGGWIGALLAGAGAFAVVAFILRKPRLRHQAMRLARWLASE